MPRQEGVREEDSPPPRSKPGRPGSSWKATPHVTESGKILLQLHAERSAAVLADSDAGFIFQQQYADSRVMVEDGETVVIAGLTVTETTEVRAGIPLLMDVPLIGSSLSV